VEMVKDQSEVAAAEDKDDPVDCVDVFFTFPDSNVRPCSCWVMNALRVECCNW
jgi:hypothetical protein